MAVEAGATARSESHDELALIGREADIDVIGQVGSVAKRHFLVVKAFYLDLKVKM